jgi:hypothetical protein
VSFSGPRSHVPFRCHAFLFLNLETPSNFYWSARLFEVFRVLWVFLLWDALCFYWIDWMLLRLVLLLMVGSLVAFIKGRASLALLTVTQPCRPFTQSHSTRGPSTERPPVLCELGAISPSSLHLPSASLWVSSYTCAHWHAQVAHATVYLFLSIAPSFLVFLPCKF